MFKLIKMFFQTYYQDAQVSKTSNLEIIEQTLIYFLFVKISYVKIILRSFIERTPVLNFPRKYISSVV